MMMTIFLILIFKCLFYHGITSGFNIIGPTDLEVFNGTTAKLSCVITDFGTTAGVWGKLDPDISLFAIAGTVPGGALKSTGVGEYEHITVDVDQSTGHYDLVISPVSFADESRYECKKSGVLWDLPTAKDAQITVVTKANLLEPYTNGSSLSLNKGSTYIISCDATNGKPEATLTMTIDGIEVETLHTYTNNSDFTFDSHIDYTYIPGGKVTHTVHIICLAQQATSLFDTQTTEAEVVVVVLQGEDSLLWLWTVLGICGGVIFILLILWLLRCFCKDTLSQTCHCCSVCCKGFDECINKPCCCKCCQKCCQKLCIVAVQAEEDKKEAEMVNSEAGNKEIQEQGK